MNPQPIVTQQDILDMVRAFAFAIIGVLVVVMVLQALVTYILSRIKSDEEKKEEVARD